VRGVWSYAVVAIHNADLAEFQQRLSVLGEDGWELVTSVSTVKWMGSGNEMVFVFKKAGEGHKAPPAPEPVTY
jgi:hypothetical protein